MTLTEFLLARIAEDERAATKLAESDRRPVLSLAMTVNHPERLLLDCEAKRLIVEECSDGLRYDVSCTEGHWGNFNGILRHLAAAYADSPDYDEIWRP